MQFWNTPRRTKAALLGMIVVTALWGSATGTAHAQTATPSAPFRIKVGGWFPYDTETRREIGGNFISFGVGYDIKRFNSFLPATLEAYLDYFDRHRRGDGDNRRDARLFGGGIAVRYALDPNAGPDPLYRPYAGAGIGIYTARASRTSVVNDSIISQSNDRTSLGGKFLLGTELRNGIFGEAEYNFVPHPSVFGNDVELSGFQVRLGYRFGTR